MEKNEILSYWIENKPGISSFILKKVSDPEVAKDILQEVFIKYWDKYNSIKDDNKISNWLISVTRNTVADYFREKQNYPVKHEIPESLSISCIENERPDESSKLIPVIYALPAEYRNILILSDILGIPHKTISEQFSLTVSCVKTRVVRGRKLLSDKMHECCCLKHDKYGNITSCLDKKEYAVVVEKFKKSNQNLPLFYSLPDNK
jgi:RNA polymerase sigma-70 factor, ECF subfamily